MATLNIYLDKRGMTGPTAPLKIAVSHKSSTSYIPTGIEILPDQWDAKTQQVIRHPDKNRINGLLSGRIGELRVRLLDLSTHGIKVVSASELRRLLITNAEDENPMCFLYQMRAFVDSKSNEGTRGIYKHTEDRIKDFVGPKAEHLTFEDITPSWLTRFDKHLAQTSPKANARAIHMRNIRAVFNYALEAELITCYPFRRFHIKHEATQKRSLTIEQLRDLWTMDTAELPGTTRALDYFKLIFLLIGINCSDLVGLKGVSVAGRIDYRRKKTGKLYSIKVEPEAMEIINRLKGEEFLVEAGDRYEDGRIFARVLNHRLKKVKGYEFLSTYWARHTWATVAASLDIPKETIAAALGHGGNSVTDIYINFDQKKIDEANRRVINYVFEKIKGER